ncbi:hypothetical protein EON68_01080 [archaeon]|nr:MAG: hypothetical protein EON68_01080 [archaeon]
MPDDLAFVHIVARMWSGAPPRRAASAVATAQTQVSLLDTMSRLGESGTLGGSGASAPASPIAGAAARGGVPAGFGRRGDAMLGTALARPPSHAAAAPAVEAPGTPQSMREAREARLVQERVTVGAGVAAASHAGGSPSKALPFTVEESHISSRRHFHAPNSPGYARPATAGTGMPAAADLADGALADIRTTLLARGVRSLFGLVRDFEAAAMHDNDGDISLPLHPEDFIRVLDNAAFGLHPRAARALAEYIANLAPRELGSGCVPALLLAKVRGPLPATRRACVEDAYTLLARNASGGGGGGGRGGSEALVMPTLEDVHMAYHSAHHPDVISGKRDEASVLREFLETFRGLTYVDAADAARLGSAEHPHVAVPRHGFLEYYANLSFYVPDDKAFALTLFETWQLGSGRAAWAALNGATDAAAPLPAGKLSGAALPPATGTRGAFQAAIAGAPLAPPPSTSHDVANGTYARVQHLSRIGYGPRI